MAKQLTVLERLENLESGYREADVKLDKVFSQIRSQLSQAMEVIEALVSVVGENTASLEVKIDERMKLNREKRRKEREEQEAKQLQQMVEMGIMKTVPTISPVSLIAARTFDATGEVGSREQFEFNQLHPDVKPAFLGKEVGYVYETQDKRRIEVLEIYDLVPQNEVKTAPLDASLTPKEATPAGS